MGFQPTFRHMPMMHQSRLWFASLVLVCAVSSAALADAPTSETLQQKLDLLQSNQFEERIRAQHALIQIAATDPDALLAKVPDLSHEAQQRIVQLLEGAFLNQPGRQGEPAEKALEQIAQSSAAAAWDAQTVLRGNARLRESRAREAIESMGGQLHYVHSTQLMDSRRVPLAPYVGVGFGPPAVLNSILLPETWQGTREDLWQLRRLSHHRDLTLYSVRSNQLTVNDLLALSAAMPGLVIQERGACLGIRGMNGVDHAEVSEVVPNGAADVAGLQQMDVILMLDKTEIRNFQHLVDRLLDYVPGQKVTLLISRDGRLMEVPVRLTGWENVHAGANRGVPAPPAFVGPLGQPRPPTPALPEPIPDETPGPLEFQ